MVEEKTDACAYVALGSNLGDSVAALQTAINDLKKLPQTQSLVCSSLYRTAPVGNTDQPDFINAVCKLNTLADAEALLQTLLMLERQHGRVRDGNSGGPRTLDLDLILYDELCVKTDHLELPHPRLHERAFVLYPLTEIAPNLVIPGRGPVKTLKSVVMDQGVERLTVPIEVMGY